MNVTTERKQTKCLYRSFFKNINTQKLEHKLKEEENKKKRKQTTVS